MKRITITYEDLWWPGPDEDYETENGFVFSPWNRVATTDLNKGDFIQLKIEATRDLEDEIECRTCVANLHWNGHLWVDENDSISGVNNWMDYPHHIHWPEKTVYEIAVDALEDYGAFEDSRFSWYSEFETINYRSGIERQYAVHFDYDDWNDLDMLIINGEIDLRHQARVEMLKQLSQRSAPRC